MATTNVPRAVQLELYEAAANLQELYIRLHPELAIVMGSRIVGQGSLGYFKDDGRGRFVLGDESRKHDIVTLDLTPWVTPVESDVSRTQ
jgi:hypothetical protein